MFAIELDFSDGISPPEIILVRRPHAIVGGSEFAHAVIEGIPDIISDVRIMKGLGREFVCEPVNRQSGDDSRVAPFEGSYSGEGSFQLGDVRLHVTSLDIDLMPVHEESPDRSGVRVLRRSLTQGTSVFPALAVMGNLAIFQSFPPDQPVVIGRSRRCGLRLDAADVSREHSRIGWDGDRFWVEDLGSTNGTRVGGERISGRVFLADRDTVEIGAEFTLMPVSKPEDVVRLNLKEPRRAAAVQQHTEYPCLVSFSETIRPATFPLSGSGRISIGRDPANDIWIGAAHVSRTHAEIYPNSAGGFEIIDQSSNGLLVDGERVPKGMPYELPQWMCSIDFTEGYILTLCFNSADVEAARTHFERQGGAAAPVRTFSAIEEQDSQSDYSERSGPTEDPLATVFKSSEHRKSAAVSKTDFETRSKETSHDDGEVQTAGIFQRMAQRTDNAAQPGQFGAGRSSLLGRVTDRDREEEEPASEDREAENEPIAQPQESRIVGRLAGFIKSLIVWVLIVGGLLALLLYFTGSFF